MNPLYLLILSLPAAHYLLAKFPLWEAKRDAAAILADGANNSLLASWHRLRAIRRGVLQAAVSAGGTAPLLVLGFWPWAVAALGLGVAGLCWFFAKFNVALNVARGLDAYRVSYSATSAGKWSDSAIWRAAWKQVYPVTPVAYEPNELVAKVAAGLLKKRLKQVLAGGALVYLLAVAGVWWLAG